jgi:hypothetical protein
MMGKPMLNPIDVAKSDRCDRRSVFPRYTHARA